MPTRMGRGWGLLSLVAATRMVDDLVCALCAGLQTLSPRSRGHWRQRYLALDMNVVPDQN